MKKAWKLSALSLCLSLVAASAWVLLNPVSAFAADGKAYCGGITSVRCADGAVRCVCEDYVGCTSHFANGTTSEAKCKDSTGFAMEEGPVS